MSEWITMTRSLQAGLKIIDRLDNGKFRGLINHLCATLQLGSDGKIFSHEEEEKLLSSLDVNKEQLIVLLDTIELIYLHAAYGLVSVAAMEKLMKESFPISEDKVSIFTNAWITHAKGIAESMRHKSIFPVQVDDVNWKLNLQSSSSVLSREARPVVWLQLGLTGVKDNTRLTVELDKNDLKELYNNFEHIQQQLDLLERMPEKKSD